MPRPLQICIGVDIAAPLVGGWERGGVGLPESGPSGELTLEPRLPRIPAPSPRALAAPPAASGGRPGRCDPEATAVAGAVAAGTSCRRYSEGRRALRRLPAALQPTTRSHGGLPMGEEGAERFQALLP